ncbi:hypothetical protein BC826DRAFT_644042 [Russula brevipes]|nr:hypothetical protein BC826DRAFT_644042 [Russula brevipes]
MFTNSIFSLFFPEGTSHQDVSRRSRTCVCRPAMEIAIEKLRMGTWIHLFREGKVCQSDAYTADPRESRDYNASSGECTTRLPSI